VVDGMTHAARACPDFETIAAYLDDRLSARERAQVTAHLAECETCYTLLSESAQTLVQQPARVTSLESWRERIRPRAIYGAAAALATAAAVWLVVMPLARPGGTVTGLVAAVGAERIVEPRLTGGFAYGPLVATRSATPSESTSPDLRIAVALIEKAAAADRSANNLHALGIAYLVTGKHAEALSILESVTQRDGAAATWSDLAAAYLVQGTDEHRSDLVAKAYDAADRAARRAPSLREAWFNRALALERLSDRNDAAKQAWEDYLNVDATSAWAEEARRHLLALGNPPHARPGR
jgi:tetratricopeptide (TPR) repeat protein